MEIQWTEEAEGEFLQMPENTRQKLRNYLIYKLGSRDNFYSEENLKQVEERIREK